MAQPSMIVRVAANLGELKKNLAEGKDQIEAVRAGFSKLATSFQGDKIIQAAHKLMHGLAELTECDVLLCNVYDQTVINVFHVPGRQPVKLTYTKGLPMPLFRGSQAHVILAHMDRRKLRRIAACRAKK